MGALPGVRLGLDGLALLPPLTGIGRYTYHLAHEMQGLLAEEPAFFYGREWSTELRSLPPRVAAAVRDSIAHWIPRSYRIPWWLLQRRFTAGVRAHGISLYHEPNYLAFRFDGPTVVTVHDLSWVRYPQMHPPIRVRMMNDMMPGVLARASHLIADSEFTRDEFIEHYRVAADRITAVPLGVTADFRPLAEAACAPALGAFSLRHRQYLLAVGTLEPRKNLATAIAAFERLPEPTRRRFPLVIVGMAGWGRDRLPPGVSSLIDRGEVRLLGYVGQEELPGLYAGARLFLYPSVYEGFGLPPLEAMACGTPVIVSRAASIPEVVGDAGLLVDALDVDAWFDTMRMLIDDDALRGKLSTAGIERAARFTWRRCAEGALEVYRRALGS